VLLYFLFNCYLWKSWAERICYVICLFCACYIFIVQ